MKASESYLKTLKQPEVNMNNKHMNNKHNMQLGSFEPAAIEKDMLALWQKNHIYEKAKEKAGKGKDYYFLDGPPYTSGGIHIGTAWNKCLKDCVLRYRRMAGFNVFDRAGYDMHGLPTELKVQKQLGIKSKDDIPEFGIKRFVEACKEFSLKNMDIMNRDFTRLGTWMDFKNAYMPITREYIEGEWWLIRKAHENKRLYEGEKTMHWCQHCATSLAKHELEYEKVSDPSVFIKFKRAGRDNEYFIVWTTTPWTLPFNMAIMVHPEFDYVRAEVRFRGKTENWIIAKGLVGVFLGSVADITYKIIDEFKGTSLKGAAYVHYFEDQTPLYKQFKKNYPNTHTVVLSDKYVDLSAGTGLVHSAPGCGPEDYEVGRQNNIPPFNNLDQYGVFPDGMGMFSGMSAKKDDQKITEEMEKRGVLIAQTLIEHDYPFCWRCKKAVIFRTTTQWFFRVEDLREKMKELNRDIQWVPDWAGSRQFHSWLDNLRDNGITRQRYWGTPLPIWRCEKCRHYEVFGTAAEIEQRGGKVPDDLHIPYIDSVTLQCSTCPGTMKRIPDILDVWVDAGCCSWLALDYPARKDLFNKLYPADFILEGKDQIRGWFNLLFVASMVSMGRPSFRAVYMHGFVNDAMGRKMSKSLANVISPYEVIDRYGADVFRYYTIGGSLPGVDLNYNFDDMNVKFRNLSVLWNIHKYLIELSAELGINPAEKQMTGKEIVLLDKEERYIISLAESVTKTVTELFESYRLNEIPLHIEQLFLELSRTYIQLVREKGSTGSGDEQKEVLLTTYRVLFRSLQLLSPIVPMISEKIFQNLKNAFGHAEESIHHHDWPQADEKLIDKGLEHAMMSAQAAIKAILSGREKIHLGVRWPLAEAVITSGNENTRKSLEQMKDLIKIQTNIKKVSIAPRFDKVKLSIRADTGKLGADFKEQTPGIIAHLAQISPNAVLERIEKEETYSFTLAGKEVSLGMEHLIVEERVEEPYVKSESRFGSVFLNKRVPRELEAEGFAREIMRRVQQLRKKHGLQKADRIDLAIGTEIVDVLKRFEQQIKDKVGAERILIADKVEGGLEEFKVKGKTFAIGFKKL